MRAEEGSPPRVQTCSGSKGEHLQQKEWGTRRAGGEEAGRPLPEAACHPVRLLLFLVEQDASRVLKSVVMSVMEKLYDNLSNQSVRRDFSSSGMLNPYIVISTRDRGSVFFP